MPQIVAAREHPVPLPVRLALAPYDALVELDLVHRRVRTFRCAREKYIFPDEDGGTEEMLHFALSYMVHTDDRESFLAANDPETLLRRLRESETPGELHARSRYRLRSGGWRWVEQAFVAGEENGIPKGIVYVFVTDAEDAVHPELAQQHDSPALRSAITGLLLTDAFLARGREVLREHPEGWCLLSIDLEHFKLFNDWYGREQGDLLLRQIGARLLFSEEASDGLAGYFGQDDFTLLMPYDEDALAALFDSIHALIVQYGTSVGFMPAFGVALADAGVAVEDLYDRAALAAHRAKENYHTRIRMFDPAMYEKADRDYRVLADFQKALAEHELFIMFQPQCHIRTERVVGAELLVRWRKASGEMVPPGVFIPVLEEYGFVTDLDKYVWEEVCAWQKQWIDGGHTPLPVSVNVSQVDTFTIDVPAHFEQLLEKYGLPVDVIKIEITESAYVESGQVADAVKRLREKGFRVLMDGFGSGYSSLNILRDLNVDIIKLDVKYLHIDSADRKGVQIMASIVSLARTMGVPIIVEGVESRQESDFLSHLGCRYVQGYYFFRPMSARDFEALIANPARIDARGFHLKHREQFSTREFLDQNVFSDAMLNNILGPMALLSRRGDGVSVTRFNQQFADELKAPANRRRAKAFESLIAREDLPQFYDMLDRAAQEPLGGAGGVLRITRFDGTQGQYRVQFFFLEEDKGVSRFYASVRDVTRLLRLNDRMRLLTRLSPDTVVFLRRFGAEERFQVATHGLEPVLGIDRETLGRELSDGRFLERLDPGEYKRLQQTVEASHMRMADFSFPFRVRTDDGREVRLRMRFDAVHDTESGVEDLLLLREDAD